MAMGIDPKVDYAFKRLFGLERNRDLLISLINAVLDRPSNEQIVEVQILNPFNPKELEEDKLSIVDVKARDAAGRLFDIEMQLAPEAYLDKRLMYYWARLYTSQLGEGDDYHVARPTISIAICNFSLYPSDDELHHRFELRDTKTGMKFTNDVEVHTIELPKLSSEAALSESGLTAWSYFLRHAESYDPSHPPATLQGGIWSQAWKELAMISLKNDERELYEARLRLTRDERAKLDYARSEGIDFGVLIGRISLMESLLGQPLSSREDLQRQSLEALRSHEQSLQARLQTRKS